MDPATLYETLSLMRGIERFTVVFFSGISIMLGWHLFTKNIQRKTDGSFKWGDFVLEIRGAAPGIFFAGFGSFILWGSLQNPLQLPLDTKDFITKNSIKSNENEVSDITEHRNKKIIYYDQYVKNEKSWRLNPSHDSFNAQVNRLGELANELCEEETATCSLYHVYQGISYYKDTVIVPSVFEPKIIELKNSRTPISQVTDVKDAPQLTRLYTWLGVTESNE